MTRKFPKISVGSEWKSWTCVQSDRCGYWLGKCNDCGHEQRIRTRMVHYNGTTRCAKCWTPETSHELYKVWTGMRQRCSNPNASSYAHYGGRGIKVCARWKSFATFLSDMGPRPSGLSLERKNRNGDYTPENCTWATGIEQHSNTSRNKHVICFGIRLVCSHAARRIGVSGEYLSLAMRTFNWPDIDVAMLPQTGLISFLRRWLKGSCRIDFSNCLLSGQFKQHGR